MHKGVDGSPTFADFICHSQVPVLLLLGPSNFQWKCLADIEAHLETARSLQK